LFFRAIALVVLLSTPAWAGVARVWDSSASNISLLRCASDDTLNASACSATTACKTGTATPSSCAVGECFFDTDASAGQNLFGCTSADTWTLLGDGTGATPPFDHGSELTGLGDDDHTQYFLLAGRSGGQTASGGTVASDDLTLDANTAANDGQIVLQSQVELWSNFPDLTASDQSALVFSGDFDQSGAAVDSRILDLSGTIHVGQASAGFARSVGIAARTTHLRDDATSGGATVPLANAVVAEMLLQSTVAEPPSLLRAFEDSSTVEHSSSDTVSGAGADHVSFFAQPRIRESSTGSFTENRSLVGFLYAPRIDAATGGTVTASELVGVRIANETTSGAGTSGVTKKIGVEIPYLTGAGPHYGLINGGATVWTPQEYLAFDSTTLPHSGFYQTDSISSTIVSVRPAVGFSFADATLSSTTAFADGSPGQCFWLLNRDAVHTLTVPHGANTKNLGSTSVVLDPGEAAQWCFLTYCTNAACSTAQDWVQTWAPPAAGGGGGGGTTVYAEVNFDGDLNCGGGTVYLGQAGCNATRTSTEWSVPTTLTVKEFWCIQTTDGSCDFTATLMNGGTASTNLTVSQAVDLQTAYASYPSGESFASTLAVRIVDDGAQACSTNAEFHCTVRYEY